MTVVSDSVRRGVPLATSKYRGIFDASAAFVGLPPWGQYPAGVWLEAQCLQESSGNAAARHYDAPVDPDKHDSGDFEEWASYGLFQIEGITFRRMLHFAPGTTINFADVLGRPLFNLALALRILKENLSLTGTVDGALAAYNGGPRGAQRGDDGKLVRQDYVDAVRSHCEAVLADRRIA